MSQPKRIFSADERRRRRERERARYWSVEGHAKALAYARENYEHRRSVLYEWRRKNPERYAEMCRQSAARRRDKINAYAREYYRRTWDKRRHEKRDAQARRQAHCADGTFTRAGWLQQLEVFGHRCAYCLRANVRLDMDHVAPLSRGGKHSIENIVPACGTCNKRKGAKSLLRWTLDRGHA